VLDTFYDKELIDCLQNVIFEYDDLVSGFANQLCETLANTYIEQISVIDFDQEEVESTTKAMNTAEGCVNAINRVIEAIGD